MALSGRHLQVAAGVWVPWVLLDHDKEGRLTGAHGIFIQFMDLFASKLNFTYSIVEAADGEWGRILPNGTTTGMIGMCHRKEVDMALGPFAITYSRSLIIDYSIPIYIDSSGIFLPRPTLEKDLTGFAKPFAWQVWTLLLILLFGSTALGMFFSWLVKHWHKSHSDAETHRLDDVPAATFRAQWLMKLMLAEPIEIPRMLWNGKVLLGTWMLAALILSSAYQGILTSLLAVPKVDVPVDTLEDLVEYGKIPWANEYGTALHQMFGEAKSGIHKKIHEGALLIVSSYDERERMKKEKFAILCDFFSMLKIISDDYSKTGECHYYIGKEIIWSASFAFAFPKGSTLIPHFNKWISMMKQGGLVSRFRQVFTSNATACLVPPGKEAGTNSLVLSLTDLAGIFLLYSGGVLLATLTLFGEVIMRKINSSQ